MSGVVFAAVAPHGSIAIAEACEPHEAGVAAATQRGMEELGRRFAAAAPEAVVVFTPHNVHIEGRMAVVLAASLEGDNPLPLAVPVDRDLALGCLSALWGATIPAAGVSFGGNDPFEAVMPLDWGALIPLWFMGGRADPPVPTVLVCPSRDLDAEAHVAAGRAVATAVTVSGKRVAVIASADHGHAHDPEGPYGYDPASAEFDAQMVELIAGNRLAELAAIQPAYVEEAKADSWWQLLMLHGVLEQTPTDVELLSYEAPTYFGMLCAEFKPRARES